MKELNLKDKTNKKNNDVSIGLDKRKLNQIPIRYESFDELKKLISFLKSKGYQIMHGLDDSSNYDDVVAVMVYNSDKTVSKTNVTCIARWCNFKRKPLSANQFIGNYNRLIVEKDEIFYNTLIEANKD